MQEMIYWSAVEMAAAVREKRVSSSELVEAHLRRIEEVNPKLNAVVVPLAEQAREQARQADDALARGELLGPLHGVPVAIKEAWEMEGAVCSGATLGRKGAVAEHDATVVARIRRAGAIPIGKTNTPELSLAFESDNFVYGRTNNPYDPSRTPGGSGGGGAAIIAAGGAPWEIGGDLGGSIRLPCHFSGIAGIKPNVGRIPLTGYFPPGLGLIPMFASAGPMARRVEDLALTLGILSGPDGVDPAAVPATLGDPRQVDLHGMRIGFHTDNGIIPATPDTARTVEEAAAKLAEGGAIVEQARPAALPQAFDLFTGLFGADGGAGLRQLLAMCGTTEVHPLFQSFLATARPGLSAADYSALMAQLSLYRLEMLAFLRHWDVILCPVNAFPAVAHGFTCDPGNFAAFSYTLAYNLTGWPGAVVRCGTSAEGLPIGVQAVAHPWREDVALAVIAHLEKALGGWRKPPI